VNLNGGFDWRLIDGKMDGRLDGWMDGYMNESMNGWMDGRYTFILFIN
jgi:hypothetical protein